MGSREKILSAVKYNRPEYVSLPDIDSLMSLGVKVNLAENFTIAAKTVGGKVYKVVTIEEVKTIIKQNFQTMLRIVSTINELSDIADTGKFLKDSPEDLADVELAVLRSDLAVAENGAVWIREEQMGQRVLPFITQHLAVIVDAKNIVATMHNAYGVIGDARYGFGTFIAGPSKTADIEQSLVIGAHGPRSMSIFLIGED